MIFEARHEAQWACLSKSRVSSGDEALATGTNLISAFELYAVASALWPLEGTPPRASAVVVIESDSAAQVLTKVGPNHSLIRHHARALRFAPARESLSLLLERVSPIEQPGRRRPAAISSGQALSSLRKLACCFPLLDVDCSARRLGKSLKYGDC